MLDRWAKIAGIAAAVTIIVSAIAGPSVGAIFWLARLDSDVGLLRYEVDQLQSDVGDLQSDVGQLQSDVGQLQSDVGRLQADVERLQADVGRLQEGQRQIIEILQRLENGVSEIRVNLAGHTHDSSGQAQLPLDKQ